MFQPPEAIFRLHNIELEERDIMHIVSTAAYQWSESDKFIIVGMHTVLTFFCWQKVVTYYEALCNQNPYQCIIRKDLVQLKHALYPVARYVVISSS